IPARVPLTPHRTTKRPKIEGTQVAIVAGPEGEEIHPDQYGRIKLWFPWDRKAKKDGTDTCWVRVAQNWAGATWGGQIIPRIGMEVMVAFVDGDPDRPLVTGVVPNARQKVPYELPANKTKSIFRTQTHKGPGFNELSFEDDKLREQIYMHAERDMDVEVENNSSQVVGNDLVSYVRHDSFERVDGNKSSVVSKDFTSQIRKNKTTQVEGDFRLSVGLSKSVDARTDNDLRVFDQFLKLKDAYQILDDPFKGAGDFMVHVSGKSSMRVVGNSTEISNGSKSIASGKSVLISGNQHVIVSSGQSIELRCGKSKIKMTSDGKIEVEGLSVAIRGARIDLN
ncbi:type VI secretion system Vgr family protein, partial [Rhizobium skierniewicense]|uniref:type VI secretion system Vgr family protein n=1 Tax=Rhizobium skierniewicense TaxID=984260 RepID=UPI00160F5BA7